MSKKITSICIFLQKYLRISKKSSTFAPAFEKREVSLAQLVEQLTLNQWVESSSLSGDTKGATSTFFCAEGSNFSSSYLTLLERLLRLTQFPSPSGDTNKKDAKRHLFLFYRLSANRSASSIWSIFPTSIIR